MLPTTFTFRVKNQAQPKEGEKMNTLKIRHKVLATRELTEPIKFTVIPRIDLMFDTKGVAEVPDTLADKLIKGQPEIYELVIEEKKEEIVVQPEPIPPVQKPKKKPEPKPMVEPEPEPELEPKVAEFIKQL